MEFELIETAHVRLWDYGWFDTSRFAVRHSAPAEASAREVANAWRHSVLFQRRLCTSPDPWGAPIGLHGPFNLAHLSHEPFVSATPGELRDSVAATLFRQRRQRFCAPDDRPWDPPSEAQRTSVERWLTDVINAGADLFSLRPGDEAESLVDTAFVWFVFEEYVAVSVDRSTLHVAIIGYD